MTDTHPATGQPLEERVDRIERAIDAQVVQNALTPELINEIKALRGETQTLSSALTAIDENRRKIEEVGNRTDMTAADSIRARRRFTAFATALVLFTALLYSYNAMQRHQSCEARNGANAGQAQLVKKFADDVQSNPEDRDAIAEYLRNSRPVDCSYFQNPFS